MFAFIFGFGLARPVLLACVLALIPVVFWYFKRLTHFPAWLQTVLLSLRLAIVVLIVLALAGPQRVEQNFRKFVMFAVDQSGSVHETAQKKNADFMAEALKNQQKNEYAVLPFAGQPGAVGKGMVEDPAKLALLNPAATDYAKASVLAEAAVPEDYVGQVVMMSDFLKPTSADVRTGRINRFALASSSFSVADETPQSEILIDRIVVPERITVGESARIDVYVVSNTVQSAVVELQYQSVGKDFGSTIGQADEASTALESKTVDFPQPGIRSVRFDLTAAEPGTIVFTANLAAVTADKTGDSLPKTGLADTLPQNNTWRTAMTVAPQGQILLVENGQNLAQPLSKALASEHLTVTARTPSQLPSNFNEFELIILSNTPATAISDEDLSRLDQYVRSGGGLIALGGDHSFTAGGWHSTKLEQIMPVECVPQKEQPRPALAMVIVLDRSGSMKPADAPDGTPHTAIELAKEAARRAVGVLQPRDQIGILAYEDNFSWPVELTYCDDPESILKQIDTIRADGGTNLYPALEKAFLTLRESFAQRKHLIVLSDGISQPGDFQQLAERIAGADMTISTIAVGEEAETQMLADLAKVGKGNTYVCNKAAELPAILALETVSAAKMGIIEKTTKLQKSGALASLDKMNISSSPSLLGYVQTQLKPGAFVIYSAPPVNNISDPILSWWKYGGINGGTVAAFTSDVESRWSKAWLRWDGFAPFWAKLVNHVRRINRPESYEVQFDGQAILVKGPVGLPGTATCTVTPTVANGPAVSRAEVSMAAPGCFVIDRNSLLTENVDSIDGTWRITVKNHPASKDDSAEDWETVIPIVENYTDEYRLDRSESLMAEEIPPVIAPDQVFASSDQSVPKTYRYWQYLLFLGLLATSAEVLLRRTSVA